ncbi:Glutamate-tRNA ligase [Hartmannibacter diazotrophicus]|uniref:Glutamate--tRNA ligase n=1 Tax=Hartmannibacter diazotrophicus TaxID=1482074 RepID=A0A2C9D796_9HYPH|nr:glutamate--tRNA ligase [Hartmannibacter diazotrophicus]SON56146.1 Glutamate-tRNA ligase [Hartmannibacter diazotrophicus]
MTVTVRFAPSPTGHIHIGNARTALFNWLFARKNGGRFILRFDDTDRERSKKEFADGIAVDLDWLGIDPDAVYRQSERMARYDEVKADLIARGLLYPCYESPDELELKRRRQRMRNQPPIYDRAALELTQEDRERLEAEGRRPHWRFLLPGHGENSGASERHVTWEDLCKGPLSVDLASLSDPVLVREDGSFLYTLPSIIDDMDMGVTHVIRGEDHVTNTGVQVAIFRALGGTVPAFGHHNLLTDVHGEGLSKRKGALSVEALRAKGLEPQAVDVVAVRIGTSEAIEPIRALDDLAEGFDLSATSRSAARFDEADLAAVNARIVRDLPFEAVKDRMETLGVPAKPEIWAALSGNLDTFADVADWWKVVTGPVERLAAVDDEPFLAMAAELLPDEPYDAGTWKSWTGALAKESGRKGRALFLPLRLALTGREHGPELAGLLPLIGREQAHARLKPV